jgi:hypothetical protein
MLTVTAVLSIGTPVAQATAATSEQASSIAIGGGIILVFLSTLVLVLRKRIVLALTKSLSAKREEKK